MDDAERKDRDSRERRSRSMEAARRLEIERILEMTPLERVRLALELGRRMKKWTGRDTQEQP